ncbi:MAG: 50S ribosomal protein L10 [Candidatus Ryanbacteria bacterium RIFCSPLOWO2_01_FULL_48_26]|uniref:Large ribosomal subunit protein uL10 n=1 Tax=Candidatus Ryanbacteria bacterium RIFCSPLOWO2_01_FULL_48_26 TaxID=1802126 RepID=A0A1G2GTX9_9BACT|nr:MAG: 50S ribosomal protein L10 [Candidatus Ryanbacteria bacterium RIFCSPLOWO2_01_FULL_48_26]OHB21544.1 MAG: 50S ribosomal protein L10 [Parcubacteria group bacterium RIFCSPHIGHO2_02_FULL_48_10b]
MKTKAQKKVEIEKGKKFLAESHALVFSDFANIPTKDVSRLRRELKKIGSNLFVIKKRLLGLVLKEKGVEVDLAKFKTQVAAIFSKPDIEGISGSVYKFFSSLEVPEGKEKNIWTSRILGAYDLNEKAFIDAKQVMAFGKLPSREIALAQALGMIAAPIRSFLYILKQKAAQTTEVAPASSVETQSTQTT